MKIVCLKLLNSIGHPTSHSGWVSVGKEYDVLALSADVAGIVRVRILSDPGTPGLHPLAQFQIVDGAIPSSWKILGRSDGGFFLGPAAFEEVGFWEKYFDGDATARRIFEAEVEHIKRGN